MNVGAIIIGLGLCFVAFWLLKDKDSEQPPPEVEHEMNLLMQARWVGVN